MTDKSDDFLTDLFEDAAARPPAPRDDFMAQMRMQAVAHTPQASAVPKPQFWADLLGSIGGWPAGAGIAFACAAGIMVGLFPPQLVTDLTADVFYQPDLWELSGYASYDSLTIEEL